MRQDFDISYDVAVPLPIPKAARQMADKFAAEQPSMEKANQVRHNTLAVWVMHDYCNILGIETDLKNSDSWNKTTRLMANVADLVLPGIGRLECRPVLANATHCSFPAETWTLRIGYGVVELSDNFQTARLLGFVPVVEKETLALRELSTPEAMIDHLHRCNQSETVTVGERLSEVMAPLSQWFDKIFEPGWIEAGWQTVDMLFETTQLTPAFTVRNSLFRQLKQEPEIGVRKGKLIDLSLRLGREQLLLLIQLQSKTVDEIHIGVQVYPVSRPYLPPNLELRILEMSGQVFMQAQARQADNYIQLQFIGQPGEPVTTQLNLEGIEHSEQLIV
ncbi:DUF1822 family protein [Leptothoe kymatousa]|uniref:DUF1822 family protein n=1 Tax=Leptothoe kymatousa TAU-MAC 1615 TaxID=2364775 RepID=A0ABS5Y726_9CYAN|nr:DUF1822 family protein [Leptothoe kymatousa]MBT9313665.1 DUF1822 family protein [Leptothoe kymatousa TAU-MAC 1615]